MKFSILGIYCLVIVVTFLNTGIEVNAEPTGKFIVTGQNPGSSSHYKGAVSVKKTGDTYRVVWKIGRTIYRGVGIYSKPIFSVAYYSRKLTGIAVYKEQDDGAWRGEWTVMGSRLIGFEDWEPR